MTEDAATGSQQSELLKHAAGNLFVILLLFVLLLVGFALYSGQGLSKAGGQAGTSICLSAFGYPTSGSGGFSSLIAASSPALPWRRLICAAPKFNGRDRTGKRR